MELNRGVDERLELSLRKFQIGISIGWESLPRQNPHFCLHIYSSLGVILLCW
jgi:hypothetical protein